MHADLRGLNPENHDFGLNQISIQPFPRHPRSIALRSVFWFLSAVIRSYLRSMVFDLVLNLMANADNVGCTQMTSQGKARIGRGYQPFDWSCLNPSLSALILS